MSCTLFLQFWLTVWKRWLPFFVPLLTIMSGVIYCDFCDMTFNGIVQWHDHEIGKRHRKSVNRWLKCANELGNPVPMDSPNRQLPGYLDLSLLELGPGWRCTSCQCVVATVLNQLSHMMESRDCLNTVKLKQKYLHDELEPMIRAQSDTMSSTTSEVCGYKGCRRGGAFLCLCTCMGPTRFNRCSEHMYCPACHAPAIDASLDLDAACDRGSCIPGKICKWCCSDCCECGTCTPDKICEWCCWEY